MDPSVKQHMHQQSLPSSFPLACHHCPAMTSAKLLRHISHCHAYMHVNSLEMYALHLLLQRTLEQRSACLVWCRSLVCLGESSLGGPSLSLLIIATPKPEEGGSEEEHRDVLQELAISWPEADQPPQASVTGCATGVCYKSDVWL